MVLYLPLLPCREQGRLYLFCLNWRDVSGKSKASVILLLEEPLAFLRMLDRLNVTVSLDVVTNRDMSVLEIHIRFPFPSPNDCIGKATPVQALRIPGGWYSQISRQSLMKVIRLSAYVPAAFTPQEIFLVLISVRGWVDPRATVRPEGLCQWKMPMIPSGIEFATFRLVAQCLNE